MSKKKANKKSASANASALGLSVEQKAYSLNSIDFADLIGVRPTHSGVNLNGQSALYVPAVLQAIRLISETIGSIPCKLHRKTAEEEAEDHSAHRIVHKRANEWTGSRDLFTRLTDDALSYGSGYALVTRVDGRPFELHRLKPGTVTALEDSLTGAPVYRVSRPNGGSVDYPFIDILRISSFRDTSPIVFGKEAIGLATILERDAAQFFGSGRRAAAKLTNESKVLPENPQTAAVTVGNILKTYRSWQSDANRDPLLLDGGWKHESETMTSTDAQFLENRVFQIDEIARIFGVPPHLLFNLDRATWGNAETMGATFLQLCLRPWLDRWQDALATVLLSEDEQDDHYFEFVVDDLMRADAASRTANQAALVTNRIMSPNEARAILNLPPHPGGDDLINPHTTSNAAPNPATAKE